MRATSQVELVFATSDAKAVDEGATFPTGRTTCSAIGEFVHSLHADLPQGQGPLGSKSI